MKLHQHFIDALQFTFDMHGSRTKEVIRTCWMNGAYNRYGLNVGNVDSSLQKLRNTKGPSWFHNNSLKSMLEAEPIKED